MSSTTAWWWPGAVVILGAVALGAPIGPTTSVARADERSPSTDPRAAARAKLVEGDRLLKAGEFQQALTAFKEAYDLFPSPKIHYNFGLAQQGMGRSADALEAFDAFLREATDAQPDIRERARAAREALLQKVGMLRVAVDVAGALVVVDGREIGRTPLDREVPLDPGPHLLLVDQVGGAGPCTRRLTVTAGAAVSAECRLAPLPDGPAAAGGLRPAERASAGDGIVAATQPDLGSTTASRDTGRRWRVAGIGTAGGGLLLLGTGALFGLQARAASMDVSKQYDSDRDSTGKRAETLQWVGYGVGAAAVVTGALLYLHGARTDADAASPVQAFFSPRGVLVEGRF